MKQPWALTKQDVALRLEKGCGEGVERTDLCIRNDILGYEGSSVVSFSIFNLGFGGSVDAWMKHRRARALRKKRSRWVQKKAELESRRKFFSSQVYDATIRGLQDEIESIDRELAQLA